VDLVINQVREFEHVDVANRDRQLKLLTCHAVVEIGLTGFGQGCTPEQGFDLALAGAVEYR